MTPGRPASETHREIQVRRATWRSPAPYGRRIRLLVALGVLPLVAHGAATLLLEDLDGRISAVLFICALTACGVSLVLASRAVVRPLHTLANLLGGLRRGDYSMRAARAHADDPLGAVMLEANGLAETLREQRLDVLEATGLLRKVMSEIDVAVFTFDDEDRLRLVNAAGEQMLGRPRERLEGERAEALGLSELLVGPTPRTLELDFPGAKGRGELRHSQFRQQGRPHTLLVVADLSRALRQEERTAWRNLVRVISHEINNSLTPIATVAGSLQTTVSRHPPPPELKEDLVTGLRLIEDRSKALSRFMRAYAKLARLPDPSPREVDLRTLAQRIASLETRHPVRIDDGPAIVVRADPDQLEQLLINLVRNAVDAISENGGSEVRVGWTRHGHHLVLHVVDDGPGLANPENIFVPFFSTKQGGSGIGLALSRRIAESHDGTLTLRNREDHPGCQAELRLPI